MIKKASIVPLDDEQPSERRGLVGVEDEAACKQASPEARSTKKSLCSYYERLLIS